MAFRELQRFILGQDERFHIPDSGSFMVNNYYINPVGTEGNLFEVLKMTNNS